MQSRRGAIAARCAMVLVVAWLASCSGMDETKIALETASPAPQDIGPSWPAPSTNVARDDSGGSDVDRPVVGSGGTGTSGGVDAPGDPAVSSGVDAPGDPAVSSGVDAPGDPAVSSGVDAPGDPAVSSGVDAGPEATRAPCGDDCEPDDPDAGPPLALETHDPDDAGLSAVSPAELPRDAGALPITSAVHQVAVGKDFTCALLAGGAVRCWGDHSHGQLGLGFVDLNRSIHTPALSRNIDLGGPAIQVVAGDVHACALLASGGVQCWGECEHGRLGYALGVDEDDLDVGDDETPATMGDVALGGRVVQLSAGGSVTCALLEEGSVRCFGSGTGGKLGILTSTLAESVGDDETPESVAPIDLGGPTAFIASGHDHSCAISRAGEVRCWGQGRAGQLGHGDRVTEGREDIGDDETPASVGPIVLEEPVVHLSLGNAHTCAVFSNGGVKCWGNNSVYQAGQPDDVNTAERLPAALPLLDLGEPALQVAAGQSHTCVLLATGNVRCFGSNSDGQLGTPPRSTQVSLEATAPYVDLGATALDLDATAHTTCAVLGTRELSCWGNGEAGNLGYALPRNVGETQTPAAAGPLSIF